MHFIFHTGFRRRLAPLAVFSLMMLLAASALAQNLVLNGSFESYTSCPNAIDQVANADYWHRPTEGTSDYFHSCAASTVVGVPTSGFGDAMAADGDAYVGVVTWVDPVVGAVFSDYREYVSGQLSTPLLNGKQYKASLSIRFADNYLYGSLPIGIHFHDSIFTLPATGNNWPVLSDSPHFMLPQVEFISLPGSTDSSGWYRLTQDFWSTGTQGHFTIGNFTNDAATNWWSVHSSGSPLAYLFIDDVQVELVLHPPIALDDSTVLESGETVVMDILANDSDLDGVLDPSSVSLISASTLGSANIEPATGELVYEADAGAEGEDLFEYIVCDDDGACDTALVRITVVGDPILPIANPDWISTVPGSSVWINILANDDPTGSSWQSEGPEIASSPFHGELMIDSWSGMAVYHTGASFCGTDSFSYRVCNESGDCAEAMVYVESECGIAECLKDEFLFEPENPVMVDVLANDETGFGSWERSTLSIDIAPTHGEATANPSFGTILYTGLSADDDSLTYSVCDEGGNCGSAMLLLRAIDEAATVDPPVDPEPAPEIIIPEIITPNGDGFNDSWVIEGLEESAGNAGYRLSIYNRWEQLIYTTTNYANDWRGLHENRRLPDGTYFYVLDFVDEQLSDRNGSLTVHR